MLRFRRLACLSFVVLMAGACASTSAPDGTLGTTIGTEATGGEVDAQDWGAIVAAARGQTVNWYLWGGSESINRFVDETYGPALRDRYGVKLRRVPIADTVDAVNQVIAEREVGTTRGAVDLIWINGENFATLREKGLLLDGWARRLPNAALVDWDNPAVSRDFGVEVGSMESPWSSAQFQLVFDTTRTGEAELPRSYAELRQWACSHPGRFTYIAPGPGAFQGTRFVKGALFELSGGAAQWQSFDRDLFDRWSPKLWRYLTELRPCLWRNGKTYPKDENELHRLFANREVDFTITQAAVGPGSLINDGLVPATSKAYVFDTNSIGDFNYVAIPANASNAAAAKVVANLLLEPAMQAAQIVPENGFGLGFAIDPSRVSDAEQRSLLEEAARKLGPAAADPAALAAALVGDAAAPYHDLVESGWRDRVLGGL